MNLMNTPHLQIPGQANAPSGDLLSGLGKQLNLDPEALKLLEQSSVENGVDFSKVLEATKNGNDPEAVIELLKAEKNPKLASTVDSETAKSKLMTNNEQLNSSLPEKVSQEPNELNSILGKTSQKTENQFLAKEKVTESTNPEMSKVSLNELKPEAKTIAKQNNPAVLENKIPQTNISDIAGTKVAPQKAVLNNQAAVTTNTNQKNLMKLDEFISKQSPSMRMNSAKKAYNPVSESMFAKKVDSSLPGVAKMNTPKDQTKLQDIMFSQNESGTNLESAFEGTQGENIQSLVKNSNKSDVQNVTKIFDINTISKTDMTNEVIAKVQDYIIQTKAGNTPEVEVSFKHDELGKIDLLVQKEHGDKIRLTIGTNSKEGTQFFTQHQRDLLSTLNSSGIQVSDFKLDSSSLSSNNQNNSSDGSSKEQLAKGNGNQQHNSQNGQRDQESRKRSELWEQFSKEAA